MKLENLTLKLYKITKSKLTNIKNLKITDRYWLDSI